MVLLLNGPVSTWTLLAAERAETKENLCQGSTMDPLWLILRGAEGRCLEEHSFIIKHDTFCEEGTESMERLVELLMAHRERADVGG